MAHEVLISYSSHDKLQADAICNRLESKGIRCWIAPRDVPVGTEYADSIVQAIETAEVLLLVYSSHADRSKQVKREVERAVSEGIKIMPVRIEDAEMSKSFEYYVGSIHWLDAITPPLESHIDKLARELSALLSKGGEKQTTEAEPPAPTPATPRAEQPPSAAPATASRDAGLPPAHGRRSLVIGGAVVLVAVVVAIVAYMSFSGPAAVPTGVPAMQAEAASYQSLVASCEQEPAWEWSCEVPAIAYIEPFLDGECACRGRILRHIETGLYRCEELPASCGGTSFVATLGYEPDMDWYEDVTP